MSQDFTYPPGFAVGTNASIGVNGAAAPGSSTEVAGKGDDGNLHPLHTDNSGNLHVIVDSGPSGGATAANQVLQIAQETGIHSDTTSIDGKLTTTNSSLSSIDSKLTSPLAVTGPLTDAQLRATPVPVSGTVSTGGLTDTQLRASPVPVSLTSTTITGSVAVTGPLTDTQLRASAVPVSLTSTTITGTVAATQSGTWNINNVSGTVSLPTGASTAAKQPALGTAGTASADVITVQGIASMTALKVDGSAVTQPVSLTSTTITGTVTTSETTSGTATLSNVSGSATSVSLLASNASRKNATFYNDSTAILYLKFGTTASTTSYTVQLSSGAYYELPNGKTYTGAIDGIWAAANGAVRITELT